MSTEFNQYFQHSTFDQTSETLPYNITLTAGEMAVVYDTGATASFNLTTACSAQIRFGQQARHAEATPTPIPGEMRVVLVDHYVVEVYFNDGSYPYRIEMGTVDNQPTWANTQAGANLCVAAVQAAFA